MCGYWLAGLWTPEVTRHFLWSLPLALAAIVLGRAINRRMKERSFLRYVHVGLLVVGEMLLIQAMRRWPRAGRRGRTCRNRHPIQVEGEASLRGRES
jgi:hypothetical protein